MDSTEEHKKTLLSGNDDCCVVYCSGCNVLELSFGAMTLRISAESLYTLSSVLNHAKLRYAQIQNTALGNANLQSVSKERVH